MNKHLKTFVSYLYLITCLLLHRKFGNLYKYSGYGIGFDRKVSYSIGNEIGRNEIIFGIDMSSPHIDNKKMIF